MGYAVYEDENARYLGVVRWAGYGVPALCDMPDCDGIIDRGLAYKCERYYVEDEETGEETEEEGCGLYFCEDHQSYSPHDVSIRPKPDVPAWEHHILNDSSWERWREENAHLVPAMEERTRGYRCTEDCEHETGGAARS